MQHIFKRIYSLTHTQIQSIDRRPYTTWNEHKIDINSSLSIIKGAIPLFSSYATFLISFSLHKFENHFVMFPFFPHDIGLFGLNFS